MHWLAHFLGLDNVSGAYYAAWSGFGGSNIGLLAVFGLLWRRHICHVRRCHRLGRHPVEGTPYVVCATHHDQVPNKGPTAEELRA